MDAPPDGSNPISESAIQAGTDARPKGSNPISESAIQAETDARPNGSNAILDSAIQAEADARPNGSNAILDSVMREPMAGCLEGKVFDLLKVSPFVLRAFEFARADGAVDCGGQFAPNESYASRLWTATQASQVSFPEFLLFDVKSKVSRKLQDQAYFSPPDQRLTVAFYIGFRAADLSFLEVIPNTYQGKQPNSGETARAALVISTSLSRFDPHQAGLDLASSPYRMPTRCLPEAIRRIRQCANGGPAYTNPWTGVVFRQWKPQTTSSTEYLVPKKGSSQYTSYKLVMDMYPFFAASEHAQTRYEFDMVTVQPFLADFRIIQHPGGKAVYVQHKSDGRRRGADARLNDVTIARNDGNGKIRRYFTAFDRFDFLWYQFELTQRSGPPRLVFFFLPECILPDEFYTSLALGSSFERPEFEPFKLELDRQGGWLEHVADIIRRHPQPRRQTRPIRQEQITISLYTNTYPAEQGRKVRYKGTDPKAKKTQYYDITDYYHRDYYHELMKYFANRGQGLLLILPRDHGVADFGYCLYYWTPEEQAAFLERGVPPMTLSSAAASVPLVPIVCMTQITSTDSAGPQVRSTQFRRLNSYAQRRLIVWNLLGVDGKHQSYTTAVIPSEDFAPTEAQRQLFVKDMEAEGKSTRFSGTLPTVSNCLNRGLQVGRYVLGSQGPLAWDGQDWSAMVEFLDDVSRPMARVQHPCYKLLPTSPSIWTPDYHMTVRQVHQQSVDDVWRVAGGK